MYCEPQSALVRRSSNGEESIRTLGTVEWFVVTRFALP